MSLDTEETARDTPTPPGAPPPHRYRPARWVRVVATRLARLIVVVVLVSVATFFLVQLVPGDPVYAVLGQNATPEQYQAVHDQLGLDKPPLQRLLSWLGDAVRGDLGTSLLPPHRSVSSMVVSGLPITLEITVLAILLALTIAVPVGMWSATRAERRVDRVLTSSEFAVVSVPSFLAGLFLIYLFVFHTQGVRIGLLVIGLAVAAGVVISGVRRARTLVAADRPHALRNVAIWVGVLAAAGLAGFLLWPDFPREGFVDLAPGSIGQNLRSVFLPVLTLALGEAAIFARLLHVDLVATLQEDFVTAARSRGMPTRHILVREALRSSSFSLLTVAGLSLGRLFAGAVVVEAIFNLPGLGSLIVNGVNSKDFSVVQGAVLVIAVLNVALNILVEALYAVLDPRIRRGNA